MKEKNKVQQIHYAKYTYKIMQITCSIYAYKKFHVAFILYKKYLFINKIYLIQCWMIPFVGGQSCFTNLTCLH